MWKLEVLPVPPEMVPHLWKSVCRVVLDKIPGYNIERTHTRLLVGLDLLWVAHQPYKKYGWLRGVIITSVSPRPPSKRKCFEREDPAQMKSLTIHVAGEWYPRRWLDSAVERINRYAREQKCRQLFLLTRKQWQRFVVRRWYSSEWDGVAISRDRPTRSRCKAYRTRNTPGYFRPLVPVPHAQWSRHRYRITGTAYFPYDFPEKKQEAA